MSDADATTGGIPAEVAVWRLISLKLGEAPSLTDFRDGWTDSGPASMVSVLADHGVAAGVAEIGPAEAGSLAFPALVEVQSGGWLVARARERGKLVLEGAAGVVSLEEGVITGHLTGKVIESLPALPPGTTLGTRFASMLWRHRGALGVLLLAALPLQLLALATPEFSGMVAGKALPNGAAGLLGLLTACVVAAAVFTGAITWFRERLVLFIVTRLEVATKRSFLDHLLRLPFPFLQSRALGDFLQAFSGITTARTLFAERALSAVFDGFLLIAYVIAMGVKLWLPTLLLVGASLLLFLFSVGVGRVQARLQSSEVEAQARQRGYLAELLVGIRTLKAAGVEEVCERRWLRYFDRELALTLARERLGLLTQIAADGFRQGARVMLLVWGGYSVLQGSLGLGPLLGFLLLGEAYLLAFTGLVDAWLVLMVLRPQLAPAAAMFAVEAPPAPPRSGLPGTGGEVLMRGVWFRYSGGQPWVLRDHHLRIPEGETYWLNGASGTGKSTTLRLLAGLYPPARGTITFGGRPASAIRQRVLYLPQHVQIYAGSIMENLGVLSNGAATARLLEVAELTGFAAIVESLPMGYHMPLPRGGATLSGGQRQLLALTASLASDRDLLLLDEPMANLDPVAAAHVARIMASMDKTIVVASHEPCGSARHTAAGHRDTPARHDLEPV